jgi:hypothetical protein
VNGLELIVHERSVNESWQRSPIFVDKSFPIGEQVAEVSRKRRDEHRCLGSCTGVADPHWGGAELARAFFASAHAGEQSLVNLKNEPLRQGQGLGELVCLLSRLEIARDFISLVGARLSASISAWKTSEREACVPSILLLARASRRR